MKIVIILGLALLAVALVGTLASDALLKRSLKPRQVYSCKCGAIFNSKRGPFGCPRCHGANGAAIDIDNWV